MKKILCVLFAFLICFTLFSCTGEKSSETDTQTDKVTEEPVTETNEESIAETDALSDTEPEETEKTPEAPDITLISPAYGKVLSDYNAFIKACTENRFDDYMDGEGKAFCYSESLRGNTMSSTLADAHLWFTSHEGERDFRCGLTDINGDGTDELILLGSDGTLFAIYSESLGNPVLIDNFFARSSGVISDGKIYTAGSGGAFFQIYETYTIDAGGRSVTILETLNRENESLTRVDENGIEEKLGEEEFSELTDNYYELLGDQWR